MRVGGLLLALLVAVSTANAGTAPKGCFEKSWNKAELKKLPLQQVTALRIEANLGPAPDTRPQTFGRVMARFRETGDAWLTTPFECNDTGAGYACAAYCDGNIFVLATGGGGMKVMPQQGLLLAGPDCSGVTALLRMNADLMPFALARRGGKACPPR